MYAVEKISSYITRGVYTVSAPFHPFGGAVDIIVVQQQDGSFKSSPWYVRFGKFQGVLKAREKVVNICVNGVDAGFHMYLDHKGEAFFLKECDSQEVGEFVITPPSSGDEMDDTMRNVMFKKVHSCNYDAEGKPIVSVENGNAKIVTRTTSRRAQLLGLMFGRRSMKESEKGGDVERVNSIERAKIAADLLETRWSTNLPSNDYRDDHSIENSDFVVSNDGNKIVSSPEKSKDDKLETSVDLNSCLRTDTSKEESVGFSGEKLEDTPKQNIIRGVHFEKIITNTSSLDTSDFSDRSEVISESVMTESDEYNLLPKESIIDHFPLDAQILGSTELSDGREVGSFSHVETSGSSPMIFDVTTQTHKTVINEQLNEVTSVSEIDKAKEIEFCRDEESFISNGQCEVNLEICSLPNRLKISEDESRFPSSENFDEEQFQFSDIDSFSVKEIKHEVSVISPGAKIDDIEAHESEYPNQEECIERISEVSAIHSSPLAIPRSRKHLGETEYLDGNYGDIDLLAKSLPIIRSEVHDIERSNLLHPLSCSLHLNSEKYKDLIQKEISSSLKSETGAEGKKDISDAVDFEEERGYNASPIKSAVELSLSKDLLFEDMGAGTASRVFDAEKENIFEPQGTNAVNHDEMNFNGVDASGAIVSSGGSWKIWPFSLKKSKTISTVRSPPESITGEEENADAAPIRSQSMTDHDDIQRAKFIRKQIRSLTPTSEELASLNLKEGRNVITFSFSTAMLGQQQVDARVYLWKWNTRIVISDVDGTITKSDVLGQFMPLVGKDWSQTGVAHLFSAIKENGYQMLFLSARAISQAYLTRQFLFNLKQDGKALPDGPVVISPDGLFPSLYREVIRRAPHEFKIKCLEDIRALFPPDCSPFYAGFGNRDTDEISYLKVGVPKGKIFIINPKGEVAVNRRVDTKSYTSLHALVNGMFPPMSTAEQEDFNSWNFWKLPVPDFEILKDK